MSYQYPEIHQLALPERVANSLVPCMKEVPRFIDNGSLRHTFQMPNKTEVIVDRLPKKTEAYTIRIRPALEPRYIALGGKQKKTYEVANINREAVIGLLEKYYYEADPLKPEKLGTFAITGKYSFLKTYLMEQPWVLKGIGKKYTFAFPNGYTAFVTHHHNGKYSFVAVDTNDKGLVDLGIVLNGPSSGINKLVEMSNQEVVVALKMLYEQPAPEIPTVYEEMTALYLDYLREEWAHDNYVMPDFQAYLNAVVEDNILDIINSGEENPYENPYLQDLC